MRSRVWDTRKLRQRSIGGLVMVAVFLSTLLLSSMGQAQTFDVGAEAALLMNARTGQILFEKNADQPLEPASLAKIMTMLVVMDAVKAGKVSLSDPVRTSRYAASIGGSQVYLAEGETHSLEKMLKAIAIASANDASVAVAEFMAGTEAVFTTLMNERAQQLGMTNSYFANADGLPVNPGERPSMTTAREIAIAARELINLHPEVLEWTSTVMERFRDSPEFILYNTNGLVGKYEGLDGLKTGHTQAAGWSLVATAQKGDMRLISVVMRTKSADERTAQTAALLDMGFNRFVPRVVAERGTVGNIKVRDAAPESFSVHVAERLTISVPRGEQVEVETELRPLAGLSAPISVGERVGEYIVSLNGKEVLRAPLFSGEEVSRANVAVRAWRSARDFVLGLFGRDGS